MTAKDKIMFREYLYYDFRYKMEIPLPEQEWKKIVDNILIEIEKLFDKKIGECTYEEAIHLLEDLKKEILKGEGEGEKEEEKMIRS